MTRIRPRPAWSMIRRSSAAPSAPISLNPAEMMMAARTPASTHSPIRSGTVGAGVTTMARSTGSGTSPMRGWALIPSTLPPLRVDGEDGPAERAFDQVPDDRPADAAGLLGRPDDGDVLGREERLQAALPPWYRASWKRDPPWAGRSQCSWVHLLSKNRGSSISSAPSSGSEMEVASAGGGWPIGLVAQPPPTVRNSFFFPIRIRKGDPKQLRHGDRDHPLLVRRHDPGGHRGR